MPALWKDATGRENARAEDLSRVDTTPERQRVAWVRAEIPHSGETPLGEHLLHVLGQSIRWRAGGASPRRFRQVHMAIPKPSHQTITDAVDHAGTLRDLYIAAISNSRDRPS